jgi:hypothetical protein
MRLYEVSCPTCGAIYKVAESDLAVGSPGLYRCPCGHILASWSDRKLRAFRLEIPPLAFPSSPLSDS